MFRFLPCVLGCVLMATALSSTAATSDDAPPSFDPDNPPASAGQDVPVEVGPRDTPQDPAEQEVRIFKRGEDEITEFSEGGRVRAIKVRPAKGPIYYLVDADGDGDLETRTRSLGPDLAIPMWILLRW